MVEQKPSKLTTRVRFPSPAPAVGLLSEVAVIVQQWVEVQPVRDGRDRVKVPGSLNARSGGRRLEFSPCSSVAEHSLGKGEVARSIRAMGTRSGQ